MAVKLPSFETPTSIGMENVQPGSIMPTYYGTSPEAEAEAATGAALGKLGTGLQTFGTAASELAGHERYQTNLANGALAQMDLHTKLARNEAAIKAESDPAKIDQLYSQQQVFLQEAGKLIPDADYRAQWTAHHMKDVVTAQLAAEARQRDIYTSTWHAGVNQKIDDITNLYGQTDDPVKRDQFANDIQTQYGSLRQLGLDPVKLQALEHKAAEDMVIGRAQYLLGQNNPKAAYDWVMGHADKIDPLRFGPIAEGLRGHAYKRMGEDLLEGQNAGPISGGGRGLNNPGNIKGPGGKGYASFPTPEAGIAAVGDLLTRHQEEHGLTTIRQLINDPTYGYAPDTDLGNRIDSKTGQPKDLVKDAATFMGVDPDQRIDMKDPATREKMTQAILTQEGTRSFAAAGGGTAQAGLTGDFAKSSGAFGTPEEAGRNLTTVTAPGGASFRVHQKAAPQIQGFINELAGLGYNIDPAHSGGYNNRNKVGVNTNEKSEHAFGTAIDINDDRNKQDAKLVTDLPPNIGEIAAKWGLKWGGTFAGTKDAMHFEVARLLPGGQPVQVATGPSAPSTTDATGEPILGYTGAAVPGIAALGLPGFGPEGAPAPTPAPAAPTTAPLLPTGRVPGAIDYAAEAARIENSGAPYEVRQNALAGLAHKRQAREFGQEHNVALAATDLTTKLAQLDLAIKSETDPAKIDALKAQVPGILDNAGKLIPDPTVRQGWIDRTAPELAKVETVAGAQQRKVYGERYTAGADQEAVNIKLRAQASEDPQSLDQATEELKALTAGLVSAGTLTPDKAAVADINNRQHLITDRITYLDGTNRPEDALDVLREHETELPAAQVEKLKKEVQAHAYRKQGEALVAAMDQAPVAPGGWKYDWAARAADIANLNVPDEVKQQAYGALERLHKQVSFGQDQAQYELMLNINKGQANREDIGNLVHAGTISPEGGRTAMAHFDKIDAELRAEAEARRLVFEAGNGGAPLNPKDPYNKKALNFDYSQVFSAWPQQPPGPQQIPGTQNFIPLTQEQQNARNQWEVDDKERKITYATKYGMVPDPIKNEILGGLHSQRADQMIKAADMLETLRNLKPSLVDELGDEHDLRMAVGLSGRIAAGIPAETAVRQTIQGMKVDEPTRKAREQAFDDLRGPTGKDQRAKDASDLFKEIDTWGSDPNVPPEMAKYFEEVSKAEYIATGDYATARKMAATAIKKVWGETRVGGAGEQGSFRWMKQPPENDHWYGQPTLSPRENAAWINEQLVEDVRKNAMVDPADPITKDRLKIELSDRQYIAPDGRRLPQYYVSLYNPKTGLMEPMIGPDRITGNPNMPQSWHPNWETSPEFARSRLRAQEKFQFERGLLLQGGAGAGLP